MAGRKAVSRKWRTRKECQTEIEKLAGRFDWIGDELESNANKFSDRRRKYKISRKDLQIANQRLTLIVNRLGIEEPGPDTCE